VDYISSSCLHVIDRLTQDLAAADRSLVVRKVSDPVRLVLELSGMAQRLRIEPR
jgi:anti-anti-sigma regulatory factor